MTACKSAIVSNIQRFSLDDGPGIRSTVFLKGCNLKCKWCHNPECISFEKDIEFYESKCTACGRCLQACSHDAKKSGNGAPDKDACTLCGKCIDTCFNDALEIVGDELSSEELFEIIKKDRIYYEESGGGVTISGGEPMMQIDFLDEFSSLCKKNGIHTAVDTAGCVPVEYFRRIKDNVDLFLYDIKILDDAKHYYYTGVHNAVIKSNLIYLDEEGKKIHVRMPLIKGINDSLNEIKELAELISPLQNVEELKLLPYHSYGEGKYNALGKHYELPSNSAPDNEFIEKAKELLLSKGIKCLV